MRCQPIVISILWDNFRWHISDYQVKYFAFQARLLNADPLLQRLSNSQQRTKRVFQTPEQSSEKGSKWRIVLPTPKKKRLKVYTIQRAVSDWPLSSLSSIIALVLLPTSIDVMWKMLRTRYLVFAVVQQQQFWSGRSGGPCQKIGHMFLPEGISEWALHKFKSKIK